MNIFVAIAVVAKLVSRAILRVRLMVAPDTEATAAEDATYQVFMNMKARSIRNRVHEAYFAAYRAASTDWKRSEKRFMEMKTDYAIYLASPSEMSLCGFRMGIRDMLGLLDSSRGEVDNANEALSELYY